MEFQRIKSSEDIELFIKKTNSLHDGYIIGVQYTNDAITDVDENGYFMNPDAKRLVLRILITSICDTIAEIEFDGTVEWQIIENQMEITDTSIIFNDKNLIVWSDDVFISMSELKNGSYVIANSMKWRIVE